MKRYRASLSFVSFVSFVSWATVSNYILSSQHSVNADQVDGDDRDSAACDANGVCQQTQTRERMQTVKDSKACRSSSQNQHSSSSVEHFYRRGISAQAYTPGAPIKAHVCQIHPTTSRDESNPQHHVAHGPFWRSVYQDVVPMTFRGNIYSCGMPLPPASNSSASDAVLDVWQPRPDGSFSSLGANEGDCRARVPIAIEKTKSDYSNLVGQVQYETLAPGATGLFGGLMPPSARDYPPYGPGSIHMYLKIEGHRPALMELNMNALEEWRPDTDTDGRFRFSGWDMRPHARKSTTNMEGAGALELKSVKRTARDGFRLALEVDVDVYLVPATGTEEAGGEAKGQESEVFCSSRGYFSWISSFFKDPIALCFPSLLDFFAV